MPENTLSNPTVEVNNGIVAIIPNTLGFKTGKGNITMRPQSAGNRSISMVKTQDAETMKSMVKFALYNTKVNNDLLNDWQDAVDGNSIRFSDGDFTMSFRNMFVIEDPERNLGADATWEITFEGQPAV